MEKRDVVSEGYGSIIFWTWVEKRMRSFFCFLAVIGVSLPAHAKPPDNVMLNIEKLAAIQAALDICFKSPAYKSLDVNNVLYFQQLYTSIDDVVQKYDKKYDKTGGELFLAFHMAASKLSENKGYKKQLASQYSGTCSIKMIRDAASEIRDVSSRPY